MFFLSRDLCATDNFNIFTISISWNLSIIFFFVFHKSTNLLFGIYLLSTEINKGLLVNHVPFSSINTLNSHRQVKWLEHWLSQLQWHLSRCGTCTRARREAGFEDDVLDPRGFERVKIWVTEKIQHVMAGQLGQRISKIAGAQNMQGHGRRWLDVQIDPV